MHGFKTKARVQVPVDMEDPGFRRQVFDGLGWFQGQLGQEFGSTCVPSTWGRAR